METGKKRERSQQMIIKGKNLQMAIANSENTMGMKEGISVE